MGTAGIRRRNSSTKLQALLTAQVFAMALLFPLRCLARDHAFFIRDFLQPYPGSSDLKAASLVKARPAAIAIVYLLFAALLIAASPAWPSGDGRGIN
jgi:hypothetical protein